MAKNRTLLPGIAVSLLLHAGLIALLAAPSRPEPQSDTRRMMVWLTPPTTAPSPVSVPVPPPLPASAAVPPPVAATARHPAPMPPNRVRQPGAANPAAAAEQPPVMAIVPAAPAAPATEQATAQAAPSLPADPFGPASAPVQGKFDVSAAMKSARKLATAKSTKDDPPVAQIYDKPLYGLPSDTPLGNAVGKTARPDCKNIASGAGILALVILPVMILTDKKDSGCKW